MVKKFVIQFELGPDTRWLIEPGAELKALKRVGETVAEFFTTGPIPAVTVIEDETGGDSPQTGE